LLEPTNEPYAIAKIAAIKLCRYYNEQYGTNFISAMPTNLYGPGDNYDPETSHVLPALIRKFHEAKVSGQKTVTIWGTGKPRREFLYIDDLVQALLVLMEKYDQADIGEFINIGSGKDITILELAELIKNRVGFTGDIKLDMTKPDGMPRKLLDVSRINNLGWKAATSLEEGIVRTYSAYVMTAQEKRDVK
jgi:GDP-L-fucose synthase